MRKQLLLLTLLIGYIVSFAGPPVLTNKDEIIAAAQKEFEQALKPEGALYLFAQENNIKGEYYYDLTLGDKKRVVTVFAIGNDSDNITAQNTLKDYLKSFQFKTFKLPKDKRYKYEQTFFFE